MQSTAELRTAFARDGVILLRDALSPETLRKAEDTWLWSRTHPGPGAAHLPARGDGTFYQDLANPEALSVYAPLVQGTEIAGIVTALFEQPRAWFMYEQIFLKENGSTRRTPWHQDTPYLPVEGRDLAVMWITFEPVAAEHTLEFVRGSHLGPLYDGSRFDPDDDTAPLYGTGELPQLPDIEAERNRWDIVSWPVNPGDVLLFHPAILHGGAPTQAGMRRRTLSLRFFGADARVAGRPGRRPIEHDPGRDQPGVHPLTRMRGRAPGTAFADPGFPEVHAPA